MSRLGKLAIFAATLALPLTASATPVEIADNYIGAAPTNPAWNGQDVIGSTDFYDISKMTVDRSATGLIVSIYSTYFDNVGSDGTRLGDLFISTNGWHPAGSAPYLSDKFGNGEFMELAAVLSDHGNNTNGATNYLGHSGTISLYSVDSNHVIQSSAPNGYIYRAGQEVQYDGAGQTALITGTWSIEDVVGSIYDRLIFSFNFPPGVTFGPELGLHYAMSCGNDTIEGGASVPEPASLALLGSGLAIAFRRRNRKA